MNEVSLCMIVKDESEIIRKTLKVINDIVDEIIIVDTGSTDNTVSIASEFTKHIHHFNWIDNFSAARNFCDRFATKDYIMTWDADSTFILNGKNKFKELKDNSFNGLDLILGSWVVEIGDNGLPLKTLAKPIIYKRGNFHWEEPIHNVLVSNISNQVVKSKVYPEITILHTKSKLKNEVRGDQTKKIIERALKSRREPRLLVYYGELLFKEKDFQHAEEIFNEFLSKYSNLEESVFVIEKLLFILLSQSRQEELNKLVEKYKDVFYYHPRFKLLYADMIAASKLLKAKKFYQEYLTTPVLEDNRNYYYDIERFYIHPRLMLANILIMENDIKSALPLLEDVSQNTTLHSTKNTVNLLIDQISNT